MARREKKGKPGKLANIFVIALVAAAAIMVLVIIAGKVAALE